ncbi:MAG: hypothetical protein ACREDJ_06165 [Methylocella sp.]
MAARAAEPGGKARARHLLAVSAEGNHAGPGHHQAPNCLRLIILAIAGQGGGSLPGLAQFEAGKADHAAGGGARQTWRAAKSRSGPASGRPTQMSS